MRTRVHSLALLSRLPFQIDVQFNFRSTFQFIFAYQRQIRIHTIEFSYFTSPS